MAAATPSELRRGNRLRRSPSIGIAGGTGSSWTRSMRAVSPPGAMLFGLSVSRRRGMSSGAFVVDRVV
jgi:hypothetical protein